LKKKLPHKLDAVSRPTSAIHQIFLYLYLGFLICTAFLYFNHYPLPGFPLKILSFFTTSLFLFTLGLLGHEIHHAFRIFQSLQKLPDLWKGLIWLGMGLAVFGTAVLLVGWILPVPLALSMKSMVFGLFLLPMVRWSKIRFVLDYMRTIKWPSLSIGEVFLLFLASLGLTMSFLTCFSPITYYDSLVYHLALPELYLQLGTIQSIPFNLYSHFPALGEMIFLFILSVFPDPESCLNLMLWGVSFCIGLGLFKWVGDRANRKWGLVAFAFWWTMPAVLLLSVGGYVEILLAFFTFLSVLLFTHYLEQKDRLGFLFLSGLFSGMACSVKYTGGITPLVLLLVMVFYPRNKIHQRLRCLLIFSSGVIVFFGPWLIKNWWEVGNPVFPFFYNVWGGKVGWTHSTASSYFQLLTEYNHKSSLLLQIFSLPWAIITGTLKYGGGFDVLGDFGWPLFLALIPLGFFPRYREKSQNFLLVYVLCHFLFWIITKPVLRFLVGGLPLFIGLATLFLYQFSKKHLLLGRLVLGFIILPFVFSHLYLTLFIYRDLQPFQVPLGYEDRKTFLARRLSYIPVYDFLNAHANRDSKVLILGDQRTYHLKVPYIGSNLFAPSQLAAWVQNSSDKVPLRQLFSEARISHLLINEAEIERLGGLKAFGFSPEGEKKLSLFLQNHTRQVLTHHQINLYEIGAT